MQSRILNRARKEPRAVVGPSPSILSLTGRGEMSRPPSAPSRDNGAREITGCRGHPCLPTVVIPPCHNTHDDHFTHPHQRTTSRHWPPRQSALTNRGRSWKWKKKKMSTKIPKSPKVQFRTMFVIHRHPTKRAASTSTFSRSPESAVLKSKPVSSAPRWKLISSTTAR